jgi:hypothetical protein
MGLISGDSSSPLQPGGLGSARYGEVQPGGPDLFVRKKKGRGAVGMAMRPPGGFSSYEEVGLG